MRLLPARLNDKPHYVFHPTRAVRRAMHGFSRRPLPKGPVTTELPWGLPLAVHPQDAIGFTILIGKVFDPAVSETLYRLIDPGETFVDVGANIGYITSLGAARAGAAGRVVAFEPHPTVHELLASNVASWSVRPGVAPVELHSVALTDETGTGELSIGIDENMGLAALFEGEGDALGGTTVPVELERLDNLFPEGTIDVLKIDVEGHEPGVLRGASELLASRRVRDIVFEDHDPYPDEATALVEDAGYKLFSIANDLLGIELGRPAERGTPSLWPGPSYLATIDPDRALARLLPRGWRISAIGPSGWPRRRGQG